MALKPQHIDVDPAWLEDPENEGYASLGGAAGSSTASLSSSVNEYFHENGRRYHAYFGVDKNLHPTDETEQDRLDLHHEIFLLLLDGQLHKAPIGETPHRILDVGTGTGIWPVDMADKYPTAEVIGVDLSPIQPVWIPPNCRFEVDDAEGTWAYQPDSFDLIHIRNLAQSVVDWSKLLSQAHTCTKPGGYTELCELGMIAHSDDDSIPEDCGVSRWMALLRDAIGKTGRPPHVTGDMLREELENAGFVDVVVERYKHPIAPWAKDPDLKRVGSMALLSAQTGYHSYGMAAFTRVLGMDPQEASAACDGAVKTSHNKRVHIYVYYYVAYGRKPEVGE